MNKSIIVGALLLAVASAEFTFSQAVSSIKQQMVKQANGVVTWKTCKSDGGFKTDFTNTKSNPLNPSKGQNVDLLLQGVWTDDAYLDAIKVHAEWDNTPLYQQEFSRAKDYSEGDILKDKITWFVPGFAPTGHYTVTLTLHDKGAATKYACIQADFDL